MTAPLSPPSAPAAPIRRPASRAGGVLVVLAGALSALLCASTGLGHFHRGQATNYDLGIFSQSAASWARGQLPTSAVLGGTPLLGDHFSPATAVFGPVWAAWPDPRSLVVAQALLLGLGTALVARCAVRHLPLPAAVAVAVGTAVAHGALAAARFDVHEVCLAVPLLALCATALLEHRHRAAALWSLPLLLVKEDMGATVAVVAVLLWLRGRRRTGLALGAAAVAGVVVAFATMLLVDPAHDLSRLAAFGGSARTAVAPEPVPAGEALRSRAVLVVAAVAGGGVLWVLSPVALLAVPTLAWRLVSVTPSYWSPGLHYGAVLVPVAAVALVDVLRRVRARRARVLLAVLAAGASAATTAWVLPVGSLSMPWQSGTWRPGAYVQQVRAATEALPRGSRLAADNTSGPYLLGEAGGGHEVVGWSVNTPLERLPDVVVLDAARASTGVSRAGKLAWLREVSTLPGVWVQRTGDTVVVHLPGRG
ncbi:DUF2079 domain-containing protein [Kineococcus auxinigenes]|uniref:DUF2079 domain-containing protein n=1 Tax=unclassified Kineococcus TaxID=2621656 RepID=UPI003D7D346A